MAKSIHSRVKGPLAPYVEGFYEELVAQGYAPLSAVHLVHVMAHASRWLWSCHLQPHQLTPQRVEQFLRARRRAGYTAWFSQQGLAPLLRYLRRLQVVPEPAAPTPETALDRFLELYGGYLLRERGLVADTVRRYQNVARRFLTHRFDPDDLQFDRLTAADVAQFVLRICRGCSTGSAKLLVSDLRSLLRFLYLDGQTPTPLAAAAPPVAGRRLSSLPQALEPDQVTQLLHSCDQRSPVGRRDYAILLLLVRLGLRPSEVAHLELDDVDWSQGEVEIHGKGRQQDRLPLPVDVGEALVSYLRFGRPRTNCRHLFLCSRAPWRSLSRGTVTALVYQASTRAGIPRVSAYRLRHTAATQMLRHGASLPEIAQVLRHRSLQSTAIYAKVDRTALRTLAQPWPGDDR